MAEPFTMPDRAAADPASDGWEPITPTKPEMALPKFPTTLLPVALREIIQSAAAEIQAPIDIAGMLALPVAASTLAGKVQFAGRHGHNEHAMLWCWTCAASAERKTPVFNLLRQPLVELAKESAEQLAVDNELRETRLGMITKQIDELKKHADKAAVDTNKSDLTPAEEAEFTALIAQRRKLEQPPLGPTTWVTSPTPEGLHGVMATNAGRVAVFSDEGGLIGILAGRYSSKGAADLDPFLSGYVGSPLKSPRASRDRPDVAAAFLTMGLAVQPSVLEELAEIGGAEDRGLIGRFLFAMPPSMVGDRMYDDSQPVDPGVARAYAAAITEWASWPGNPGGTQVRIPLDEQALRAYSKFHDSIERRNKPDTAGADLADIPAWGGKIAGTTLRIAGLFHCYTLGLDALRRRIEECTVLDAIEFTNSYLIPHAKAAFTAMEEAAASQVERRILRWIVRRQVSQFRVSDLYQGLKGKRGSVQKAADLQPALDRLEVENYLRRVEADRADSVIFEVNPLWNREV